VRVVQNNLQEQICRGVKARQQEEFDNNWWLLRTRLIFLQTDVSRAGGCAVYMVIYVPDGRNVYRFIPTTKTTISKEAQSILAISIRAVLRREKVSARQIVWQRIPSSMLLHELATTTKLINGNVQRCYGLQICRLLQKE
jgi:hypothetical protein